MFYITGDRHANIRDLVTSSQEGFLTESDTLIILGDAGFNYFMHRGRNKLYSPIKELGIEASVEVMLEQISMLKFEILVIQGNHEAPAWLCTNTQPIEIYGSEAVYDPHIPNVKYLLNGEVYNFNGKEYLVMGGAYSIDKSFRERATKSAKGLNLWFPDEQMTDDEFEKAESRMNARDNQIHGILSHTCPKTILKFMLLNLLDSDYRMEEKFDEYRLKFKFDHWYFGHFHMNYDFENFHCLHMEIKPLK